MLIHLNKNKKIKFLWMMKKKKSTHFAPQILRRPLLFLLIIRLWQCGGAKKDKNNFFDAKRKKKSNISLFFILTEVYLTSSPRHPGVKKNAFHVIILVFLKGINTHLFSY